MLLAFAAGLGEPNSTSFIQSRGEQPATKGAEALLTAAGSEAGAPDVVVSPKPGVGQVVSKFDGGKAFSEWPEANLTLAETLKGSAGRITISNVYSCPAGNYVLARNKPTYVLGASETGYQCTTAVPVPRSLHLGLTHLTSDRRTVKVWGRLGRHLENEW